MLLGPLAAPSAIKYFPLTTLARGGRVELSEREWRSARIDGRLEGANWRVVDHDSNVPAGSSERCAVREYPTERGPADYALVVGGRILGAVEAKKRGVGPQEVLRQAERYSKGATRNPFNFPEGYRVPFLYSTNGEIIWFRDARHPLNRQRKVAHFHTPDALEELLGKDLDDQSRWLNENPVSNPRLRPYQVEAIQAMESAISERYRTMLLAMATGCGKTYLMINQIYRLMKSGLAKRVLFLVDRRALAAQAVREFASFEAEPGLKFDQIYEVYSHRFRRDDLDEHERFDPKVIPSRYLTDPDPSMAFVYVCTIQRMGMYLLGEESIFEIEGEEEEEGNVLPIPIHTFDVVVADECHRGYTATELSRWRNTLDHFDAIKIGLTATPAVHTTTYFSEVVYRYPYERAVREGFLVDYDVVALKSDVRLEGLFLHEGEQVGRVDPETGLEQLDLLEDERKIEAEDVERKATAPESNRRILEEVKKFADDHEQATGRFPKTLVFADNDIEHISHAEQLVGIVRDVFRRGDGFVQKITGKVDRPLQRIREFRNRPNPGIAITVDLLSTGVDIPDLEFIVFLRSVKSRILFEQMMGRGTRRGEKFQDKSHFTVFDCFDGTLLEYFRNSTGITIEPPDEPTRPVARVIDDIWENRDRDYNISCLIKRLHRIDKQMSAKAREMFAAQILNGDVAQFARELRQRLEDDFAGTMAILRDSRFQDLLVTYPRAERTFLVAYEAEDVVTSEWRIRGADGKEYRPEDYLLAFARFIQEHMDEIDAIAILLSRPRNWSTRVLTDLRERLRAAPERFTIEHLQKAHELRYDRALADIISMVKHAVSEEEPLLTAEERVARAMARVTAGKRFSEDQRNWLDRIQSHLVANLTVEKDDFDLLPIFERAGGFGRANKAFEGRLEDLLDDLNEAVVAA
jgi:type I restriction enzyme R subunit